MSNDLFIEIKEELRREKFYKFLVKLIPWFMGVCLVIIIMTVILTWREKNSLNDQNTMSEIFYKSLATEKLGKIDSALESHNYLIDNHTDSYASLAALKKAAIFLDRKEFEMAYKVYEELIKLPSTNKLLKNFAETKMSIILFNNQCNREVDLELLLDRLQNTENPWRAVAIELKVLWLLNHHQNEKAVSLIDISQKDEGLLIPFKQRLSAIKSVISRSDNEK